MSNKKYRPLDPPLNLAKKLSPLYRFDQTHYKLRNVNSVLRLGLCWQRISAFAAGPMSRNKSFEKLQQLFRQASEYWWNNSVNIRNIVGFNSKSRNSADLFQQYSEYWRNNFHLFLTDLFQRYRTGCEDGYSRLAMTNSPWVSRSGKYTMRISNSLKLCERLK